MSTVAPKSRVNEAAQATLERARDAVAAIETFSKMVQVAVEVAAQVLRESEADHGA